MWQVNVFYKDECIMTSSKIAVFLNKIKYQYNKSRQYRVNHVVYKIIDDDKIHEEVVFGCCHLRTSFSCHISEAIFDSVIIEGLLPEEACYLGIRYGCFLASAIENNKIIHKKHFSTFSLKHKVGRYKINYEDREGNICYLDHVSNQPSIEDPRQIAANAKLISQFDSTQACYIGILAGIKSVRHKNRAFSLPTKLVKKHLRLLKTH